MFRAGICSACGMVGKWYRASPRTTHFRRRRSSRGIPSMESHPFPSFSTSRAGSGRIHRTRMALIIKASVHLCSRVWACLPASCIPSTYGVGLVLAPTWAGLNGGDTVDFLALLSGGLRSFRIRGINPRFDSTLNPNGFPTQLFFDQPSGNSFTMTPLPSDVPEPGSLLSVVLGAPVLLRLAHGGFSWGWPRRH